MVARINRQTPMARARVFPFVRPSPSLPAAACALPLKSRISQTSVDTTTRPPTNAPLWPRSLPRRIAVHWKRVKTNPNPSSSLAHAWFTGSLRLARLGFAFHQGHHFRARRHADCTIALGSGGSPFRLQGRSLIGRQKFVFVVPAWLDRPFHDDDELGPNPEKAGLVHECRPHGAKSLTAGLADLLFESFGGVGGDDFELVLLGGIDVPLQHQNNLRITARGSHLDVKSLGTRLIEFLLEGLCLVCRDQQLRLSFIHFDVLRRRQPDTKQDDRHNCDREYRL